MKIKLATRADNENMKYFEIFKKSVAYFHPEIEIVLYDYEKMCTYKDKDWFYRASPIMGMELIDTCDLLLLMDCDQIVTGNLDFILNKAQYDIGTVLNINRVDPTRYGYIKISGVEPPEYFNNGFVAIRNSKQGKDFLNRWYDICHSKYFYRFQYREQDVLNILAHFGGYNVKCFDNYDKKNNYYAWHGLVSKGEWQYAEMRDGEMVIPKGKDGYPDTDTVVKVLHWAGGKDEPKLNYRLYFTEECITYLNKITS
jgi:lipopolysaccharide biosynthesis glycosyltransferase